MWWSNKEALEIAERDAPHLEDATTLRMSKRPHVPCEGGGLTRKSTLYPFKMCQQAARMMEEIHGDLVDSSFAVTDATDCDMDCLKTYTDQELQTTAGEVVKPHPSRQTFSKMLRDRMLVK